MYDIDIVLLIMNVSLSIHIELLLIYIMYDIDIVLLIKKHVLIHSCRIVINLHNVWHRHCIVDNEYALINSY